MFWVNLSFKTKPLTTVLQRYYSSKVCIIVIFVVAYRENIIIISIIITGSSITVIIIIIIRVIIIIIMIIIIRSSSCCSSSVFVIITIVFKLANNMLTHSLQFKVISITRLRWVKITREPVVHWLQCWCCCSTVAPCKTSSVCTVCAAGGVTAPCRLLLLQRLQTRRTSGYFT